MRELPVRPRESDSEKGLSDFQELKRYGTWNLLMTLLVSMYGVEEALERCQYVDELVHQTSSSDLAKEA